MPIKIIVCFALILAFFLSILCTSRAMLAPLKTCTVVCGMSDTYLAIESERTVTERGLLAKNKVIYTNYNKLA